MQVVSGREFRANQSKFLSLASSGEDIVLKSRTGSFRIVPLVAEDSIERPKNLVSDLRGALQEVKDFLNGNENKLISWEEMIDELHD